jgi:hypothetical protein
MSTELLKLALAEEGDVCVSDGRNVTDCNSIVEAGLLPVAELILILFAGHGKRRTKLAGVVVGQ